jgi:hypothetical protein
MTPLGRGAGQVGAGGGVTTGGEVRRDAGVGGQAREPAGVRHPDLAGPERPTGEGHDPQPPAPHLDRHLALGQPGPRREPVGRATGPVLGPHAPGIEHPGQRHRRGQAGLLAPQLDHRRRQRLVAKPAGIDRQQPIDRRRQRAHRRNVGRLTRSIGHEHQFAPWSVVALWP